MTQVFSGVDKRHIGASENFLKYIDQVNSWFVTSNVPLKITIADLRDSAKREQHLFQFMLRVASSLKSKYLLTTYEMNMITSVEPGMVEFVSGVPRLLRIRSELQQQISDEMKYISFFPGVSFQMSLEYEQDEGPILLITLTRIMYFLCRRIIEMGGIVEFGLNLDESLFHPISARRFEDIPLALPHIAKVGKTLSINFYRRKRPSNDKYPHRISRANPMVNEAWINYYARFGNLLDLWKQEPDIFAEP